LRVETIPLILGILVALVGIGLLADAWLPEDVPYRRERRRRARQERHLGGEAAIGVGVLCMAAALIGRDSWPYSTVVMIVGAVMILVGGVLNKRFFRDRIVNRGALRRGTGSKQKPPEEKDRIR
jgi:peptidoglycan/LPS O-acetylase OafA/YrhL